MIKNNLLTLVSAVLLSVSLISCSDESDSSLDITNHTVTFNTDGGSLVAEQNVNWGECAQQPENPVKTGYTFSGWYYGSTQYSFSQAVTDSITLTAKWHANSYRIEFNNNGGQGNMESLTCTYDTEYTLPPNTFTRPGSTFTGWALISKLEYADGATIKNLTATDGAIVTLNALWSELSYHLINYENLGEAQNSTLNPRKFYEKDSIVLYEPGARAGYTFGGWYLSDTFAESDRITSWTAGTYKDDVTIYAKWNKNAYTLTLHNIHNPGQTDTEYTVHYGDPLPDITVEGVTDASFGGFYTLEYGRGDQYINAAGEHVRNFTQDSDLTLYALWTYKIIYDTSNISVSFLNSNPTTCTGENDITLAEVKLPAGYTFLGWEDSNHVKITKIAAGTSSSVTVLSRGVNVTTYTITYETSSGTWVNYTPRTNYTMFFETFRLPDAGSIQKTGYTFAGWYTNEDFSGEPVTEITTGTTGDITLYAKWTSTTE